MKTLEEKAKAYDEVLKQFKGFKPDERGLVLVCPSDIFPELAESEDERIRKWIINYLNNRILNSAIIDEKKNCMNAIAWLEKQGNNMGISETTKQKLEDNLNKALEKETPESWNEFIEKQGEKETNGNEREIPFSEQKPAWSEKDERMKNQLVDFMLSGIDISKAPYGCGAWLKSLKDRLQPQPKQEWSEEDEYFLAGVIETEQYMLDVVNGIKKFNVGSVSIKEQCTEELAWLKSLRPQNRWKPSDEQMKQLGWIAEQNKDNMIGKELMSLYQDLKKLMEE